MSSQPMRSLCEALARCLSELAPKSAAAGQEQHRRLLARRAELLAAAAGPPPDVGGLAARAAALEDDLAQRRSDLATLEASRESLRQRESQLAADLARSFAELGARCEALIARLPLLGAPALQGWLAWLEGWHRDSLRPFEPQADWARYFAARNTAEEAFALVEPLLAQIQLLDVGEAGEGLGRAAIPAEMERKSAALRGFEADLAARLAAAGDYGRIAADLPDPAQTDSLAKMERLEGLLQSLEATLGRFAASARIERQMLEALA